MGGGELSAIETNYREFLRHLCTAPGAEFVDDGRAAWASTGLPLEPLNTVVYARFGEGDADESIGSIVAWFRERGLPFGWWVGPGSTPRDTGARLESHGLRFLWESPSMARDLERLPTIKPPSGITIERVLDDSALTHYVDALLEGFEAAPADAPLWRHVICGAGVDATGRLRHYVAREDDRVIGTSTAFLDGNTVGLYNISTVPEERGRGIGAALTVRSMLHARGAGARRVVLLASKMGAPLYHELGFEEDGRIAIYDGPGTFPRR